MSNHIIVNKLMTNMATRSANGPQVTRSLRDNRYLSFLVDQGHYRARQGATRTPWAQRAQKRPVMYPATFGDIVRM